MHQRGTLWCLLVKKLATRINLFYAGIASLVIFTVLLDDYVIAPSLEAESSAGGREVQGRVYAPQPVPQPVRVAPGAKLKLGRVAICIAGDAELLQRPLLYRSIRYNFIDAFRGTEAVDVFAYVDVSSAKEQQARQILTSELSAKRVEVRKRYHPSLFQPRCRCEAEDPKLLESGEDLHQFVYTWLGIEACYQQVVEAEAEAGRPYDWVMRAPPNAVWHTPLQGMRKWTAQSVLVQQQKGKADQVFLSPRKFADDAFKGVLKAYHACWRTFDIPGQAAGDAILAALQGGQAPSASHSFRTAVMHPRGDTAAAKSDCMATSVDNLGLEICMRLLYGFRQDPVGLGIPSSDQECRAAGTRHLEHSHKILVATPLKNAARYLSRFAKALNGLSYPKHLMVLGLLVSDSQDGTLNQAKALERGPLKDWAAVKIFQKDFHYVGPQDRHEMEAQTQRRIILSKSRNELLKQALTDDIYAVLWFDVDVTMFPPTMIEDFIMIGLPVLVPNIALRDGWTYDRNSWRENLPEEGFSGAPDAVYFEGYDHGAGGARDHMDTLMALARTMGVKDKSYAVRLHGVGTAVLFVKADVHRQGIIFPEVPYKHRLESEGFGLMAGDKGYPPCGMPLYQVGHAPD